MVALNAIGSGEQPSSTTSTTTGSTTTTTTLSAAARSMVAKGHTPLHHRRRRQARGAIATGFGYNNKVAASSKDSNSLTTTTTNESGANPASSSPPSSPEAPVNGEGSSSSAAVDMSSSGGGGTSATAAATSSGAAKSSHGSSSTSPGGKQQQPQHNNAATSSPESTAALSHQPPTKPCHSARMAVLCCQNAIQMGARVQLGLCPPGRSRRSLQAALRQRTTTSTRRTPSSIQSQQQQQKQSKRTSSTGSIESSTTTTTGSSYYALEKMIGTQSLEDYENQEEDYLLSTNTFDVDSDEEASSGDEDDINNLDSLLEPDKQSAVAADGDDDYGSTKYNNLREPLFTPIGAESNPNGAPSMSGMGSGASGKLPFNRRKIRFFDGIGALERQAARDYLSREATKSRQRNAMLLSRHLKRMQQEEKRKRRIEKGESLNNDNNDDNDLDMNDTEKQALLAAGVSQFEQPMTAAMSAALILESLSLNPIESIEGMAKCYDGIVAAGVALLESQMPDPTSPTDDEKKERPSRADILAALAPLLITSLDQASGEVIVLLAKLRRMCGTPRYQRRFVQRVAPCLIRPRGAAMWCLRHQHDMEPILAAAELIFDSAHEVFCKGWYEKGQLYLADSKRAETLDSAAKQLRNLSAEPTEGMSLGFGTSHGMRRNHYMSGSAQMEANKSSDHLAEWEVMAVDREIRLSISKIMSSDWNKVVLTTKDSDSVRSHHRRAMAASKRPAALPQSSSGEASPRAMITSPRSPSRLIASKTPLSPPKDSSGKPPEPYERIVDHAPPLLSSQSADRPMSPDNASGQKSHSSSLSPPPHPIRMNQDENDLKPSNVSSSTPPRSPKSPHPAREQPLEQAPPLSTVNSGGNPFTPISPRRSKSPLPSGPGSKEAVDTFQNSNVPFAPSLSSSAAPLSPSSVGTSNSASDMHSFRPSSGSSIVSSGSGASQTAHYRTLTSTASERKRTVAACRALRAQITRFEDAFFQLHGRPPKGAAERAPLATTYSQYREWKRAIRADAACRIQALFRGARTRWLLMRSQDSRMRRIVLTQAGRVQFPNRHSASDPPGGQGSSHDNLLNHIGIPVEIGASDNPAGTPTSMSGSLVSTGSSNTGAPGDGFNNQPPPNTSLAPQWASQVVRRPRDASYDGFPPSAAPNPHPSPPPSAGADDYSDLSTLSLSELQTRKRELKQQLKLYDMNFARRHRRMPVKAEKEPIRHLYEKYNQLKSQITLLEQEGRHQPPQIPGVHQMSMPHSRGMSPPSPSAVVPTHDSSDDSSGAGHMPISRSKKKHVKTPPTIAALPNPSSGGSSNPSQDLQALKAEKSQLHQMLRSYEKDFFKEHKRQVSSFADIKPVASQYRRYKEIKKAIAQLQQSGER